MLPCTHCVVECLTYHHCLNKYYITTIRKLPVVIMSALKFSVNLSDSFNSATFVFLTQIQVLEKYRECVNENICQSLKLLTFVFGRPLNRVIKRV